MGDKEFLAGEKWFAASFKSQLYKTKAIYFNSIWCVSFFIPRNNQRYRLSSWGIIIWYETQRRTAPSLNSAPDIERKATSGDIFAYCASLKDSWQILSCAKQPYIWIGLRYHKKTFPWFLNHHICNVKIHEWDMNGKKASLQSQNLNFGSAPLSCHQPRAWPFVPRRKRLNRNPCSFDCLSSSHCFACLEVDNLSGTSCSFLMGTLVIMLQSVWRMFNASGVKIYIYILELHLHK